MANFLDYQCPTCKALIQAGFPHGCMNVSNYKSATSPIVGPPLSGIAASLPSEVYSEGRSDTVNPSFAIDAPEVARDSATYPPVVMSITVTPATASVSNVGGTQQYQAVALMSDGSSFNLAAAAVTWVSSAPAKATIAATGLATGASGGAGTTNITATFNSPQGGTFTSPAAVLTLT